MNSTMYLKHVLVAILLVSFCSSQFLSSLNLNLAQIKTISIIAQNPRLSSYSSSSVSEQSPSVFRFYHQALRWQPECSRIQEKMSQSLWFSGQQVEARKTMQQLADANELSPLGGYFLGWSYLKQTQSAKASQIWQVTNVPADALLVSRHLLREEDESDLLDSLVNVSADLPVIRPRQLVEAAWDYENWGRREQAAHLWQRRASLTTVDDAEYWYAKGEEARLSEQFDIAANLFTQASERWPLDRRFAERRTYALMSGSHWVEGAKAAEMWAKQFPDDPTAYWWAGEAYRILQDYESATKWFSQAVVVNPNYTQAFRRLGNVAHDDGRYADAIKHYEAALAIEPTMSESYFDIGQAYYAIGDTSKAIEFAELALANFQRDWCPWSWYGQLGAWYREEEQIDAARLAYENAVICKPDFAEGVQALTELSDLK